MMMIVVLRRAYRVQRRPGVGPVQVGGGHLVVLHRQWPRQTATLRGVQLLGRRARVQRYTRVGAVVHVTGRELMLIHQCPR